jgi:glycosidase
MNEQDPYEHGFSIEPHGRQRLVARRGDLPDLSALLPGSNGDGIGDLKGITARLPHIASLGVDAIWISPFFTSPMRDFGYDVSDYCDVDPMFGTLADFDALIAEAHRSASG